MTCRSTFAPTKVAERMEVQEALVAALAEDRSAGAMGAMGGVAKGGCPSSGR